MNNTFCDKIRRKLLWKEINTKSSVKKLQLAFMIKCLEVLKKLLERIK